MSTIGKKPLLEKLLKGLSTDAVTALKNNINNGIITSYANSRDLYNQGINGLIHIPGINAVYIEKYLFVFSRNSQVLTPYQLSSGGKMIPVDEYMDIGELRDTINFILESGGGTGGSEVEGNPTVPSGVTPASLETLKIEENYFSVSKYTAGKNINIANNQIKTIDDPSFDEIRVDNGNYQLYVESLSNDVAGVSYVNNDDSSDIRIIQGVPELKNTSDTYKTTLRVGTNGILIEKKDLVNDITEQHDLFDAFAQGITPVTYSELRALRDNNSLKPGTYYRITDYEFTALPTNRYHNAGHVFDIIVLALSNNKLSEEAKAIQHEGDTYFTYSDLSSWRLWYCLDNDTTRFDWADSTNGKGVIYRMIDQCGNDYPYDFKNLLTEFPTTGQIVSTNDWVYSFHDINNNADLSLSISSRCKNNIRKASIYNNKYRLNGSPFIGNTTTIIESNFAGYNTSVNVIFGSCRNLYIGNESAFKVLPGNRITAADINSVSIENVHIESKSDISITCGQTTIKNIRAGQNSLLSGINYFGASCENIELDSGNSFVYITAADTIALKDVYLHTGVAGSSSANPRTITVTDTSSPTVYYPNNYREVILDD